MYIYRLYRVKNCSLLFKLPRHDTKPPSNMFLEIQVQKFALKNIFTVYFLKTLIKKFRLVRHATSYNVVVFSKTLQALSTKIPKSYLKHHPVSILSVINYIPAVLRGLTCNKRSRDLRSMLFWLSCLGQFEHAQLDESHASLLIIGSMTVPLGFKPFYAINMNFRSTKQSFLQNTDICLQHAVEVCLCLYT